MVQQQGIDWQTQEGTKLISNFILKLCWWHVWTGTLKLLGNYKENTPRNPRSVQVQLLMTFVNKSYTERQQRTRQAVYCTYDVTFRYVCAIIYAVAKHVVWQTVRFLKKKSFEHEMCVLIFSTTIVWGVFYAKKNRERYDHQCKLVLKYQLFLSDCNESLTFSTNFPKTLKYRIL